MTKIHILLFTFLCNLTFAQNGELDVKSYDLYLEPNIEESSIYGVVAINFTLDRLAQEVVFDAGDLKILEVKGEGVLTYKKDSKKLLISLKVADSMERQIEVKYSGKPTYGINFNKEKGEIYTVFSTSQWMICNDDPADKATIKMEILSGKGRTCIASGELMDTSKDGSFSFQQSFESPSYTYGFAIGNFNLHSENSNQTEIRSYSAEHNLTELKQIFQYTGDMISFFEEKTGVSLIHKTYSQILMGNHYQEMSGFSVLKSTYGKMILADSTETNLVSHELAHQWWGNMITCQSWRHFWLNEAFATFMSAAYNEHRFGKEKYEKDINSYKSVYQKVLIKGNDKPLVFPHWQNPSSDDRNIVYFKGAYVLHLLRTELGEEAFWKGIKSYSQTFFGKSVRTIDFQMCMEESTGRSLSTFFDKWVY